MAASAKSRGGLLALWKRAPVAVPVLYPRAVETATEQGDRAERVHEMLVLPEGGAPDVGLAQHRTDRDGYRPDAPQQREGRPDRCPGGDDVVDERYPFAGHRLDPCPVEEQSLRYVGCDRAHRLDDR